MLKAKHICNSHQPKFKLKIANKQVLAKLGNVEKHTVLNIGVLGNYTFCWYSLFIHREMG